MYGRVACVGFILAFSDVCWSAFDFLHCGFSTNIYTVE